MERTNLGKIADDLYKLERQIERRKARMARFKLKTDELANRAQTASLALHEAMRAAGRKALESRLVLVELKQSPPSVVFLEGFDEKTCKWQGQPIPPIFTRPKVEPDRVAIKKALENGRGLEFAELKRGTHLQLTPLEAE